MRFFVPSEDVDDDDGVMVGKGGNGGRGISVNGGGGGGEVNFPLPPPVDEVEEDEPGSGRSCCERCICLVGVDVKADAIDVFDDEATLDSVHPPEGDRP